MTDNKEQLVEQLLKAEGRPLLDDDFTTRVMGRIRRLPDPALLAKVEGRRGLLGTLRSLGPGEIAGALLVVAGAVLLLVPGSLDMLSGLGWMLEGFSVNLSLGETALSASMATVATAICCMLMLLGLGAYGARHKLIVT